MELNPSKYDTGMSELQQTFQLGIQQFTLVLTASKSRKTRVGFENQVAVNTNANRCCGNSIFASADLWGILVTLFLQV